MKMNVTRWSPDTCGCIIEYEWDSDLPENERTHNAVHTIPCELHRGKTHKELFDHVGEENRRKNVSVSKAMDHLGLQFEDIKWGFDKNRNVELTIEKADQSQKKSLQDKVDKELGKVKII